MTDKSIIQKIEDDKRMNIKKTMDHPINDALRGGELKDTISSQQKSYKLLPGQISISLDKYENKIIKKRKS